MEKMPLFGEKTDDKENLLKQTGRGILTVGTIIGAGVLLGMGIGAVTGGE